MLNIRPLSPSDYACIAFICLMTLLAVRFVWTDTLGAYSDDSVSYVLMAQAMSPYYDTTNVVQEAARQEQYPPLFSLFLALSGVSHSYLANHITVALMFSGALVLTYLLAIQILNSRLLALLVTVIFALSPSVWLNMLGILSENMYLVLSLATILLFNLRFPFKDDNNPALSLQNFYKNGFIQIALLLSLVILCRSLGIALVAAYAATYLVQHKHYQALLDWRLLLPALLPVLVATIWPLFRDSNDTNLYASDVSNIISDIVNAPNRLQYLLVAITPQLSSLVDSWYTAFELYWGESLTVTHLIISCFALCSLSGLILRLKHNHLDAWYVLFYLLILLVWPYPGQFNRFIYVLMPLFIIHGIYLIYFILQKFSSANAVKVSSVAVLFVVVSVAPASAFIYERARYVTPFDNMDFSHVTPFYNVPNIDVAEQVAYRHEHLRQDFQKLNATVSEKDIIMWYTPNYINLIAHRKAVRFPKFSSGSSFLQSIENTQVTYVFSSDLNPRYTDLSVSGLQALHYFENFTEVVWVRKHPKTDKVLSMLLKIDHQKLSTLINKSKK